MTEFQSDYPVLYFDSKLVCHKVTSTSLPKCELNRRPTMDIPKWTEKSPWDFNPTQRTMGK